MEESIYNLVQQEPEPMPKAPLYRSRHPGDLLPTCSTFGTSQTTKPGISNVAGLTAAQQPQKVYPYKKSHATIGKHTGKVDPSVDYLRADKINGRIDDLQTMKTNHPDVLKPTKLKEKSKPPMKTILAEKPVSGLVSNKNFVVANAVETILAAPKKLAREEKDYLRKEDYGRVPEYLVKIKKDVASEYEYIKQLQAEEDEARSAQQRRLMPEEEKQALLQGLKAKWQHVNSEYQLITHQTKLESHLKARKEGHERALTQLEKDIEKLSKGNVYIDATQ